MNSHTFKSDTMVKTEAKAKQTQKRQYRWSGECSTDILGKLSTMVGPRLGVLWYYQGVRLYATLPDLTVRMVEIYPIVL